MSNIFSMIIAGEVPCYKVAESNNYLAFLDINPITKGHTLVIPKQETDYFFDLDDDTLTGLMLFTKRVAAAIEKVIKCERIGVAIIGLEVPHAHVHLAPINGIYDIDFSKPKVQLSEDQFQEIAATISKAFNEAQ